MSTFSQASYASSILTTILLLALLFRDQAVLVKPSYLCILFYHIQVQWGAAIESPIIEVTLNDPWDAFVLFQAFPCIALLGSALLFRRQARAILELIRLSADTESPLGRRLGLLLVTMTAGAVTLYLLYVPWGTTGLYALMFDPSSAHTAREESFKLIDFLALQYLFNFMTFVIAPMAAVLVAFQVSRCVRQVNFFAFGYVMLLAFLLFAVSLYGARGPAGMIALAVMYAFYLRSGVSANPLKLTITVLLVLGLPSIVSALKESTGLSFESFQETFLDIIERATLRGMRANIWHIDYVQRGEFFGVAAIPKLAFLWNEQGIDTFNLIGITYVRSAMDSISATPSFCVHYYTCFGLKAFVPSLCLVWGLDLMMFAYPRIHGTLMIPCLSAIALSVVHFSFTSYTTVLISKGFLLIPLACAALQKALFRFESGMALPGRQQVAFVGHTGSLRTAVRGSSENMPTGVY